jgi:hypothetical protein
LVNTRHNFKHHKHYELRQRTNKEQSRINIQKYLDKHFKKHKSLSTIPKTSHEHLYFYIFSQENSEYGTFGITNDPFRRIGEYIRYENANINFSKPLKTQLWYGMRDNIFDLETKLLSKIKCYKKYDHLLVLNRCKNQLEFFPSFYRNNIEELVVKLVNQMT